MERTAHIAGLVLAAGEGRRFGGLKQLEPLGPRLLMEYALESMLDVDLVERVAVTLGAGAEEVRSSVDLAGAEPIGVPGWEEGVAASLRAGVEALGGTADAIVVLPADHPLVSAPMITRVIEAWDGGTSLVRATHEGKAGEPVLVPSALYPEVLGLEGDSGLDGLARLSVVGVECGPNVLFDVDLAEDLAELRDSAVGGATE